MKICLTGGTGFIGSKVKYYFEKKGFEVINITRGDFKKPINTWKGKIEGANLLINLAGAPIYKRWSVSYKREIIQSRVETSKKLVEAFELLQSKPPLVISASAVGIYNEIETHDEFSDHYGSGFLAHVCKEWEASIAPIACKDTRLVILRIGVVLDAEGGALAKMLPPFRIGVGAVIGNGLQAFPYIHSSDFLAAIWFIYKNEKSEGVYNIVAPEIVSNKYFSKQLGKLIKRPVIFSIPTWFMGLVLGEGAVVLTQGQKVRPSRLLDSGFAFKYETINSTLIDMVN